jgi:DNA polymerase-1
VTPLFLVDGHQLLYRAWFGFPARITSRDKTRDLTGVFGFLALLRKAHRLHGDAHEVVVVFDGENAADARLHIDDTYKANRADADHTPIKSLWMVKNGLDAAGVRWLELDQYEADDVLATLVSTAASAGHRVVCFTGDRDLYQILDHPRVSILTPGRASVTAASVTHRYGVQPRQWPDYRALTGDAADHIPGVRGIGPKTAAALLADGWSLDDLPGSARVRSPRCQPILDQWQQVLTWRDLIRLNRQVPVPDKTISGKASGPLPKAAEILDELQLW